MFGSLIAVAPLLTASLPIPSSELTLEVQGGIEDAGRAFALVLDGHLARVGRLDGSGTHVLTFPRPETIPDVQLDVYVWDGEAWSPRPDDLELQLSRASGTGLPVPTVLNVPVPARSARILAPIDGALLGSRSFDVVGEVGSLAGTPGLSVTVNGEVAQLTGQGGFRLDNLAVDAGAQSVRVEVRNALGQRSITSVDVDVLSLSSNNVALAAGRAYAALGTAGYAICELETREVVVLPPPPGQMRVDDVAVADGLLFLLNAGGPGRLSLHDLTNPDAPSQTTAPRPVSVGPFTGVSAGGGKVIVSGGTSLLQAFQYDASGVLGASAATIDLGVGQPDVLLDPTGTRAYVSTDFASPFPQGQSFGVTTVDLLGPPAMLSIATRTGLPGSGFTSGGSSPANFPIESALLPGGEVVTAHGGGLSRLAADGTLMETTSVTFPAVNVDVRGTRAFVVGGGNRMAIVDFASGEPDVLSVESLVSSGPLRGVAVSESFVVLAATTNGLRVLRR